MSKEALTVEVAIDLTQRSYAGRRECAAVRSGMGDAASICDAIIDDLASEHAAAGGRSGALILKERMAIAKRCGDAIWEMRKKVLE
jgi:hypothetical protein